MRTIRRLGLALALLGCFDATALADIPYDVEFQGVSDKDLARELSDNSRLMTLRERQPASMAGLQRRADDDAPLLRQILHNAGYWAASVEIRVDGEAKPVKVVVAVTPGPLYHLAGVTFETPEGGAPPLLPELGPSRFGLETGGAARAQPVIDAEGKILELYGEKARPLAKIADRRVVIDDDARTMAVTYVIEPGPELRFGPLTIAGLTRLDPGYVQRRIAWREGAPYDQSKVAATQRTLVDSNLFSLAEIGHAAAPAADGTLPMTATLTERLPRSVGAGINYDTTLGFGALAYWENRNLFGNAERLRITTQFGQSQLGLLGQFRKPDFGRTDQDLLAAVDLADEAPVAYESRRWRVSSGLERRIDPTLTLGAGLVYDHGNVTAHSTTQHFELVGVPLYARRDTTGSLLNPVDGYRAALELTPYHSTDNAGLAFVTTHLSGSAYHPLAKDNRFVIAGYARLGSIFGEGLFQLPADKRLYVGGGGSVRGYGYQLVGNLDANNKPFGGRSSVEAGAELRYKITEAIALVPFLDAGEVSANSLPRLTERVFYSVGLGARYDTPVGPVRFDVATPLSRRSSDSLIQVYVSLGQAF